MKQFLLIFSIFYALLAYNPLHINITNLLKDFKFISALQNYKVTWHQLKDGSIVDIRQSEKNGETIDIIKSTNEALNKLRIHQK
jgi:hypothetical protein